MSEKFIPKSLRVGQRVKVLVQTLTDEGYTYADIEQVHGPGHATVRLIHKVTTVRPVMRFGPSDFQPVPGKPRFPHIDGKVEGFGEKREGAGAGDGDEDGEAMEVEVESDGEGDGKADGKSDANGNPLLEALEEFVVETVTEMMGDAKSKLDEERVREIAAEEAARVKHGKVTVKVHGLPDVELEGAAHAALTRVLKLARAKVSNGNIALIGPAGSGKTTLAKQVSKALSLSFASMSCSPGMSESKLLGRTIPKLTGDEPSVYETTAIVETYRNGGVILLDELDNADPSILTVMNTMLDNGFVNLPDGSIATRHPDTIVLASMNTFGHGADRIYVGRTALDGATLDRFTGTQLELDYDRALEAKLCPEENIRKAVHDIRDKVRAAKLRRIVSTRFLLATRTLHLSVGDSLKDALRACTTGWTDGDLKVVGLA